MVRKPVSFKGIPIIPDRFADLVTWHKSRSPEVQASWEETRERYLEAHLFTASEARQLRFIPKRHTALKVIVALRRHIVARLMRENFTPRKAMLYKSYRAKVEAQPGRRVQLKAGYSEKVKALEERFLDIAVHTVAEQRSRLWGSDKYETFIDEVYPVITGAETLEELVSDFFDESHVSKRLEKYRREGDI